MPTLDFNVSNTDPGAGRGGKQAPPGLYKAEIHEINHRTNRGEGKGDDLEVIYRILKENGDEVDPEYNRIWDYVGLENEATEWKLAQFLEAIGVASEDNRKGSFDPEEHTIKFNGSDTGRTKGTRVMLRVKSDTYRGEARAKVAAALPLSNDDVEDDPFS